MRDGSRERGRRYPLRIHISSPDSLTPRSARSASGDGWRGGVAGMCFRRPRARCERSHVLRICTASAPPPSDSSSGTSCLFWPLLAAPLGLPVLVLPLGQQLRRCCESLRGPLMQHLRHRRHGHAVSPTQTSCLLCWSGRIVGPLGLSVLVFDVGPGLRTALHRDDDSTGAHSRQIVYTMLRPFCQCSSA